MLHVLVYGDSLTWGIIPDTRRRLPFEARWPGVMEAGLVAAGHRVRVTEDCLNGRRTAWDDPFKPGRNGLEGLAQRIEINSPLALVIVGIVPTKGRVDGIAAHRIPAPPSRYRRFLTPTSPSGAQMRGGQSRCRETSRLDEVGAPFGRPRRRAVGRPTQAAP